jgi:transcriptional antiterminator NusG
MGQRVFKLGDRIRITSGPFAAFTGRVDGINQAKALLKVRVEIFGRVTPVKISFVDAEKVEFDRPLPPDSTPN